MGITLTAFRRDNTTRQMINEFVHRYFTDEEGDHAMYHIPGGSDLCADTVIINEEMQFSISEIREALHHSIPGKTLMDWYNYKQQLHEDTNGSVHPTNLVPYFKGAPEIKATKKQIRDSKKKLAELYKSLDEEIEKNKSEEYKAKEEQRKLDAISIVDYNGDSILVIVYDAKQALKQYHINNGELR